MIASYFNDDMIIILIVLGYATLRSLPIHTCMILLEMSSIVLYPTNNHKVLLMSSIWGLFIAFCIKWNLSEICLNYRLAFK